MKAYHSPAEATYILTDSARAVLRTLATSGPITRPQLSQILSLSKPTMSAAISELEARELVTSHGTAKGAMGRTAVTYGLGPQAGYAIGIDAGTTHVHAIASSLSGEHIATVEHKRRRSDRHEEQKLASSVSDAADSLFDTLKDQPGPIRAIAVAVPTIVSPSDLNFRRQKQLGSLVAELQQRFPVPLILENNVNCAALAELHGGAAEDRETFAYLQVGVKIGLGIIIGGRLHRGFSGAAGEIGRLPFPWSETEAPVLEDLERYLGSAELIARSAQEWPVSEGPAPTSAEELFARAETSDYARSWVNRHATDIGRLAAACVAVLDPGLVVLGGGVGQNPLLIDQVSRVVGELTWPTKIAVSRFNTHGTVLGAVQLAVDYSLGTLLGEERHPAFVVPPPAGGEEDTGMSRNLPFSSRMAGSR